MKLLEIAGDGVMKIATKVAKQLVLALEKHLPNAGNNDVDVSYTSPEDSGRKKHAAFNQKCPS